MGRFDHLRTRIHALRAHASNGEADPELLAVMEDALSEGYIAALTAEAEVGKLRAELALMREQLVRQRAGAAGSARL
jgi:hypothetical protein